MHKSKWSQGERLFFTTRLRDTQLIPDIQLRAQNCLPCLLTTEQVFQALHAGSLQLKGDVCDDFAQNSNLSRYRSSLCPLPRTGCGKADATS